MRVTSYGNHEAERRALQKLIKSAENTSIFDKNLVGSEQYQLLFGLVTKLREMCAEQK
jgi:hypothetical protein